MTEYAVDGNPLTTPFVAYHLTTPKRKPWKFVVMGKEPSVTNAAKSFSRHVMASAHRVVLAELLLDEGIAEQA